MPLAAPLTEGVVYIGTGAKGQRLAKVAAGGLTGKQAGVKVTHLTENDCPEPNLSPAAQSRWLKVNLDRLSPYDLTLYLDADTEVLGDLGFLFAALRDGWDMLIAPSKRQGTDVLGHLSVEDRALTLDVVGTPCPLNLQAGVFAFRKNEATAAMFAAWRAEWGRVGYLDQGALLRAMAMSPVRVWILSWAWNGGGIIDHHFGRI